MSVFSVKLCFCSLSLHVVYRDLYPLFREILNNVEVNQKGFCKLSFIKHPLCDRESVKLASFKA